MAGLDPLTVAKMLEVLSPVRPAQDYKQGGPVQPWWRSAKGGLAKVTR